LVDGERRGLPGFRAAFSAAVDFAEERGGEHAGRDESAFASKGGNGPE
jgi:hypothetical protein